MELPNDGQRREWLKKSMQTVTQNSNNTNNLQLSSNPHQQYYDEDRPHYLISSSRDKNVVLSELKYSNSSNNNSNNPSVSSTFSILMIPIWKFEGHGGWVNSFTLLLPTVGDSNLHNNNSNDSTNALYIATTSDDDTIRIVDLTSSRSNAEVRRVTDTCRGGYGCLSVAPLCSSSKLVMCSGGSDKMVSVWGFKE